MRRGKEKSEIGPMNLWRVLVETYPLLSENLPLMIHTLTAYSKRHTKVRHGEKEKERERERERKRTVTIEYRALGFIQQ